MIKHGLWMALCGLLVALAGPATSKTLYVDQHHPAAADNNPGTEARPFLTINAAAGAVEPGDVVIVRPGVYRESVVTPIGGTGEDSRVTFSAEPPREAIVDGADIITGFEPVSEHPGVYRRPDTSPMWELFEQPTWKASPYTTAREQTYVDGKPLLQVMSRDKLISPGTFFAEVATNTLYVWLEDSANPNAHQIEYTTRNRLWSGAGYVTIRGFVLQHAHAIAHGRLPGHAVDVGSHAIVENNVIQWASGTGLHITSDMVIRDNVLQHNGQCGASGGGKGVLFEGNTIRYNNWRHFGGWETGGVKFCYFTDSTVRANNVYRNDGVGLWFDLHCDQIVVEQNRCHNNTPCTDWSIFPPPYDRYRGYTAGIVVEISRDFLIRNNLCYNNGGSHEAAAGILLAYAYRSRIYNNTCYNNRFGISIFEHRSLDSFDPPYDLTSEQDGQSRGGKWSNEIANAGHGLRLLHGASPAPHRLSIVNNLCFDNYDGQFAVRFRDSSFRPHMARRMEFSLANNLYWDSRNDPPRVVVWGYQGKEGYEQYHSLREWQLAIGGDANSLYLDPQCVDPQGADFRLLPGSPAYGAGKPVPEVDFDFAGHPRDARAYDIGAWKYTH